MLLNLGLNKFTMKTLFYALLITVLSSANALSQEFYPLSSTAISYQIKVDKKEEGRSFSLEKEVRLRATGSDDSLILKNLKFYNIGFTEARLTFDLKTIDYSDLFLSLPGNYFITLSFYDEDKKCLVSSSFTSSGSMVLYEEPGNDHSNAPMKLKMIDAENFEFSAEADVSVHHAFFYGPKETAAGIKSIKYVSISLFHLGAG